LSGYSRVYHSIVDDPKFATVYDHDRRLATWLRLLIVADQAFPASGVIPAGTNRAALQALVDVGLVDLGTGSRFRIHGLAAEREMRSQSARNAAASRWQSERNAKAMLDETRRDENKTSIPPPPTSGGRRSDGTNPRATGSSPRQNGHAPRDEGTSPRQRTKAEKRDPTPIHVILAKAAANRSDA
jgi:hypothetical protein